MTTELVASDPVPLPPDLALSRAPAVVLEEARQAARALKDVLDAKAHKVVLNGEMYLEFEDWQTLGRFYGVTAKVEETRFVEYGDARGFEARAVALRVDGAELSAAESACLSDEPRWRSKPLFQLKSMAQTRACAKVLRNVLAWAVVLAGYKATPAEELDPADDRPPARDDSAPPLERPLATRPRPRRDEHQPISRAQQKKLFARANAKQWPTDALKARLFEAFSVRSSSDLRVGDFDQAIAIIDRGPAPREPGADDVPF